MRFGISLSGGLESKQRELTAGSSTAPQPRVRVYGAPGFNEEFGAYGVIWTN